MLCVRENSKIVLCYSENLRKRHEILGHSNRIFTKWMLA